MPASYIEYLQHSVMEGIQTRIQEDDGIATWKVEGHPWPLAFPEDVKAGLDRAMRSYEEILQELETSAAVIGPGKPEPVRASIENRLKAMIARSTA